MAAIRPIRSNPSVGGIVGGILSVRDEIENPTPGNPVGPVGRAVCNAIASTGYQNIPLNSRTGPGFVCEPYWNGEGIDPPEQPPAPFSGGQCEGVSYDCDVLLNSYNAACEATPFGPFTYRVRGPVKGLEGLSPQERCGTTLFRNVDLVGTRSDGTDQIVDTTGNIGTSSIFEIVSLTVKRADGQPDDCGDPPLPPSTPGPSNPGTPYGSPIPLPGFPDVDIVVDPPVLPPDGGPPYWPIEIRDPSGNPVGGPVVFSPSGNPPDLPPPPPPPVQPGPPQEPSDPAGDIPDDIPPEDEDEGLETIGYEWTLTGLPGNLSRIPGTSPAVLTTPYGNVQLRYEDGTGATRYSDNLPIRVVSGSILRQDTRLTVKGVVYSRRPDIGGIRLTPLRVRRM